jgi:spermidine synthase
MAKRLLRVGDIFLIEKGQLLYAAGGDEVRAGEPTEHQEYTQDKIVVKGREYFFKNYLKTVQHVIPKVGEYTVLATEYGGGSRGGGMNGHDDYPDGHKVTAKPVKGRGPKVSFYQTGCFTAMLESPKLVKKAVGK